MRDTYLDMTGIAKVTKEKCWNVTVENQNRISLKRFLFGCVALVAPHVASLNISSFPSSS